MDNLVSKRLEQKANEIMKAWEARANEEVLGAFHLESLALRDSLPELLSQIGTALMTTIDRTELRVKWDRAESLRVGKKHGHERAESFSYTMDQMIFEYHILRQVIFDVLEVDDPIPSIEREVIVCAIEQAVNDAATQFSETLRGIQERLASMLAHDLRSPILAAKGSAQLLLRKTHDSDKCIQSAKRICVSLDRIDSMIIDLLDASRIRAGQRLPMQREACDMDELVRQAAIEFNQTYGNRFRVVSEPHAVGFWSKSGVRRVIDNLATNAAKYSTPETPITITVRTNPGSVAVSVHNLGVPISSEDQAMMFQQFHRSKSVSSLAGWGIGLTIVKGVTEAHGGKVQLESGEGKGTRFTVELPS